MPTDAQKRAAAKWSAAHMVTLGVKMRRELAVEFEALTARNGTTRNAVLLQAVRDYVTEHRAEPGGQESAANPTMPGQDNPGQE